MIIAVISDIHGNHYALNQVLILAKKYGVEKLLVLGDIVGYYYYPDKVIALLREWPIEIIKGNHENTLQDLYECKVDNEEIKRKYGSGHELALTKLSDTELNWLFHLPEQLSVHCDGVSFQLNHGSPMQPNIYLYPDTGIEILEQCNSNIHDFVLIGHSHYSFSYRCKHSTLINSGSVGQSRQKGGIANWLLINTENKCYQVMATPYDVSSLVDDVRLIDPDFEYGYSVLIR